MASWETKIRQQLSSPGESGSNSRRIAEGTLSIDGVDVDALGASGSWWKRLWEAAGKPAGRGSYRNRLAPAGAGSALRRIHDDETFSSDAGD